MYNINILFNDYHNFNKNVKNHFNITKDNTDIDWDDFEKTVKELASSKSIVNVHLYDGLVLSRNILEMFNKYGVEVTLSFNDKIDDAFLIDYYFKYIIVDRLTIHFGITGEVEPSQIYYLLHKLWSSYKMYHIYDPNFYMVFSPNLNDKTIEFLSDNLKRQCDNRKAPIPGSFFEYVMRNMIKERDEPYIPYDVFVDDKNKIILNKDKFNIAIDFSIDIKELDDEHISDKFISTLNIIYSSIVATFGCDKCIGYNSCQKMNTIFCGSAAETCAKDYEKLWTAINPHIQYFIDLPQYTINETKGNVGLS